MNRTWLNGLFKQRLWWWVTGALVLAGLLVLLFGRTIRNMDAAMKDWLPAVDTLSHQDSAALYRLSPGRWQVLSSICSRVRNPVSYLRVDHQYRLVLYRVDVCDDTSWNQLMHVLLGPAHRTPGLVYRAINRSENFQFEYRAGPVAPACRLVINLSTDTLRTVYKSDSLLSFYFKADALTLRYAEGGSADISIESTVTAGTLGTFTQRIPMVLGFLRRPGALYFLFLTSEEPEGEVPPDWMVEVFAGAP